MSARWLVVLALVVGVFFAPGEAQAVENCKNSTSVRACSSRQAAYEACVSEITTSGQVCELWGTNHYRRNYGSGFSGYWGWNTECPVDTSWDDASHTCAADYVGPTDEECQAINAQPGFVNVGPVTRSFESQCRANGCVYERVAGDGWTVTAGGVGTYNGTFEWTRACTSPPPPEAEEPSLLENPPDQVCNENVQPMVCVKRNGEHCFAASTGKQLCWRPGETGTKTSGNTAQKRTPGTQPPTPPTPPEGEEFTQGPSVTTTTTNNTDNSTTTTTVTNFVTIGGTDAGPDEGEPDDGSGDDELGGSGDCDAGYAPSGDPILGAILMETHASRCAGEKADEDNRSDAEAFGSEADSLEVEGESFFGTGDAGAGLNESWFSWGSGVCPVGNMSFSMGPVQFTVPSLFCDTGAVLAALFTLIAYVWGMIRVGS